jgi:hypothetical protein
MKFPLVFRFIFWRIYAKLKHCFSVTYLFGALYILVHLCSLNIINSLQRTIVSFVRIKAPIKSIHFRFLSLYIQCTTFPSTHQSSFNCWKVAMTSLFLSIYKVNTKLLPMFLVVMMMY